MKNMRFLLFSLFALPVLASPNFAPTHIDHGAGVYGAFGGSVSYQLKDLVRHSAMGHSQNTLLLRFENNLELGLSLEAGYQWPYRQVTDVKYMPLFEMGLGIRYLPKITKDFYLGAELSLEAGASDHLNGPGIRSSLAAPMIFHISKSFLLYGVPRTFVNLGLGYIGFGGDAEIGVTFHTEHLYAFASTTPGLLGRQFRNRAQLGAGYRF